MRDNTQTKFLDALTDGGGNLFPVQHETDFRTLHQGAPLLTLTRSTSASNTWPERL